ncbi:MAG: tetratricopeptide repeat protein [Candidatus Sabulitectum sp.]|nr:tetratricopeptide repeat protein [Candidatus Sabulitectum sp.]
MVAESIVSLRARLKTIRQIPESDTEIVDILNKLAAVEFRNSPEMAEQHAKEALSISQEIGLEGAIAESLHMCSITSWVTGEFTDALESCMKSLHLWVKLGDRPGIARAYNNLGNIYRDQGDYSEALEYHLKSLEIKEESEDRKGIANSNLNIGNIHKEQGHLKQAETYYARALALYQILDNQLDIAKCYNNLGIIRARQGDSELAVKHHAVALEIWEALGDTRGMANSYGNLGSIYDKQNNYEEALECYLKALHLGEKLSSGRNISVSCFNTGSIYTRLGNFDSAHEFIERGMRIAIEMGARDLEASSMSYLADLYQAKGDFKQAFHCERKYRKINEQLFSEESKNKIALLHVKFEMGKKKRQANINRLKNLELQKEITERRRVEEELKTHRNHLQDLVRERTVELLKVNTVLGKSFKGTIFLVSRIVEERDPYSSCHQIRTAELARAIAENIELSEDQTQAVYLAAVVHDIGKIRVPQEFLSRSGKLSEIELNVVRTYPQAGYDILKTIEFPWPIADIVLQHHEFLDGSGYPSGLKGKEIMQEAQILCAADMAVAMSSRRPYRPAFGIEAILEELSRNQGIRYDSNSVNACIHVIHRGQFNVR